MLINHYNCQQLGPKINTDVDEKANTIVEMEANKVLKDISHLGVFLWAEGVNQASLPVESSGAFL